VKVALDAIKPDLTIAQLVAKHGIHQTLINGWKKQATDRLSTLFEIKPEGAERATPFYGARHMARHRSREGCIVSHNRIRRLMAKMGFSAV
jgi:transposase-like protein